MTRRHGQAWSLEEDAKLESAFRSGLSIAHLAQQHERGGGAIRARLVRLGHLIAGSSEQSARREEVHPTEEQNETVATASTTASATALTIGVDRLITALVALKAQGELGVPKRQVIARVARAYDQLDALLMDDVAATSPAEEVQQDGDPLPDRLREALAGAVRACVADLTDRSIAIRLLGLEGDGERVTLARLGGEFHRSAERIRQRRNRAFKNINAALPRRIASSAKLRSVLAELSAQTDWTDPAESARAVVSYVNDSVTAAKQLTLMLMLASGASPRIASRCAAEQAAVQACRDPELLGRWRLDHWTDAAAKAILRGPFARFEAPPADMVGAKRSPAEGSRQEAIPLHSEKLQRVVACESGMEVKVYSWLERSEEVLCYQEQPIAFAYAAEGRDRLYYPDVVVWDREGRVLMIEVKPVFNMFRRRVLEKGLAAIAHLQPRGIGYLLVDSSGRTLADLATQAYDVVAAEAVEALFADGPVSFRVVKEMLSARTGRFDFGAFVSMVINRDWAVTETPVSIWRMPESLSFRPLLGLMN
jgi:hypothetical protein